MEIISDDELSQELLAITREKERQNKNTNNIINDSNNGIDNNNYKTINFEGNDSKREIHNEANVEKDNENKNEHENNDNKTNTTGEQNKTHTETKEINKKEDLDTSFDYRRTSVVTRYKKKVKSESAVKNDSEEDEIWAPQHTPKKTPIKVERDTPKSKAIPKVKEETKKRKYEESEDEGKGEEKKTQKKKKTKTTEGKGTNLFSGISFFSTMLENNDNGTIMKITYIYC